MNPEDKRRASFLEHLSESEKRLGASRHSVFDALFVGIIAVVIVGGLTLGIMRMRTAARTDQPQGTDVRSVAPSVSTPAVDRARVGETSVPRPAPAAQTGKDERSAPSEKEERPSIDASKPGKYTITGSKVQVEINTLPEKERDEKLEQLKKEGLLTEREVQELKRQQRSR